MVLHSEIGRRPSTKKNLSRISVLVVLLAFGLTSAASAVVTKTYNLVETNTSSGLYTDASSNWDYLKPLQTGTTPTWLDPNLSVPPANYGSDAPAVTKNTITVQFTDDGGGNIIDGTVTITEIDFFHDIDAGIDGLMDILGLNDVTMSGAVGSMTGGVVTSWSSDLSGELHNELGCFKLSPGGICGAAFGLPEDGDTRVTHETSPNGTYSIDTAGAPDVASQPMTFNVDYSRITILEMTIDQSNGRQFFSMTGVEVGEEVPFSNTPMQLLVVLLMAITGFYMVKSEKIGRLLGRAG